MIDYWRQLDFFDPARHQMKVLVVGAGATGSYLVYALKRMGVKDITVIDFDNVEVHNLPNQFFTLDSVGLPKVEALQRAMQLIDCAEGITFHNMKFEEFQFRKEYFEIVIPAVDLMSVRKLIYEWSKAGFCQYIIDPRAGGLAGELYEIDLDDEVDDEYYQLHLFSDEEVDRAHRLPCSGRSIIDATLGLTAAVTSSVRRVCTGKRNRILHWLFDFSLGTISIMQIKEKENKAEVNFSDIEDEDFIDLTTEDEREEL